MEHSTSIERSLDASHLVPDHELCGHPHGHHFNVSVTFKGRYKPELGEAVDWVGAAEEFNLLLAELNGRDLNVMMQGTIPTADAIGLWLLERMPSVWEIKVSDWPWHTITIVRPVR